MVVGSHHDYVIMVERAAYLLSHGFHDHAAIDLTPKLSHIALDDAQHAHLR